jgi:hypothetical protein
MGVSGTCPPATVVRATDSSTEQYLEVGCPGAFETELRNRKRECARSRSDDLTQRRRHLFKGGDLSEVGVPAAQSVPFGGALKESSDPP